MLRFLHISDLHVGQSRFKSNQSKYELCHEDFCADIEKWVGPNNSKKVDGLIITGDLTFSGSKQDFDESAVLVEDICEAIKTSRVFIVPGKP